MVMWRVRTVFSGPAGSPWLSTMFFDAVASLPQDAVNTVGGFWGAIDARMKTTVTWATEPDVTEINEATGLATNVVPTTPQAGAGASTGDLLPRSSQALIRWRSGSFIGGREVRGRTFIPGLDELQSTSGGALEAAAVTAFNTAAAAAISSIVNGLVIYSPAHATFRPAITGTTWSQFAVLRSRRD